MWLTFLLACQRAVDTEINDNTAEMAVDACAVVDGRPASWVEASHGDGEPAVDVVFDRSRVHETTITMTASEFAAMRADMTSLIGEFGEGSGPGGGGGGGGGNPTDLIGGTPSWFEASVQVDGEVWCHVGVRYKGNSSLSGAWGSGIEKIPFRIDFGKYEDDYPEVTDQHLYGFEDLTFANGMNDASLLHDLLASEILNDRGVPAAENALYAVWWDVGDGPAYRGLYTGMEDPDDVMMARVFGDDEGSLYKPTGDCANWTCYDADSFAAQSDAADGVDAAAAVAALAASRTDAAAWRANLETHLDVDGFLRWLAVNSAMENWDSYGAMAQNYYLYGDPADNGRLHWVPWDHSWALTDGMRGSNVMKTDVTSRWPLIRYLLDDPVYEAAYRDHLATAVQGAFDEAAFAERVQELHDIAAPYAIGADGEVEGSTFLMSDAAFEQSVDDLVEHAADQRALVEAALADE